MLQAVLNKLDQLGTSLLNPGNQPAKQQGNRGCSQCKPGLASKAKKVPNHHPPTQFSPGRCIWSQVGSTAGYLHHSLLTQLRLSVWFRWRKAKLPEAALEKWNGPSLFGAGGMSLGVLGSAVVTVTVGETCFPNKSHGGDSNDS